MRASSDSCNNAPASCHPEEERGRDGWYAEPSDELTFPYFAASLKGRVAALVGQDGPDG